VPHHLELYRAAAVNSRHARVDKSMLESAYLLPDFPSAVLAAVEWGIECGHHKIGVDVGPGPSFCVSANGPGLSLRALEGALSAQAVKRMASIAGHLVICSRAGGSLSTYSAESGTVRERAQPRRCSGVDIIGEDIVQNKAQQSGRHAASSVSDTVTTPS
jgi:hypothetical protein